MKKSQDVRIKGPLQKNSRIIISYVGEINGIENWIISKLFISFSLLKKKYIKLNFHFFEI